MTVPTDATPNGLPPFDQYARSLTAEPLWENIAPPVVTIDEANPDYPVKLVVGRPPEAFAFTPEEALDLAVRLIGVATGVDDGAILSDALTERSRQVGKGYTPEHDEGHGGRNLLMRARAYLTRGATQGNRSDIVKSVALLLSAGSTVDRLSSFDARGVPRV